MTERVWPGLTPAQAEGQACVMCARNLRFRGSVPVGRSHTGSQVFACVGECVSRATAAGGQLLVTGEALTAAGMAFLEALERATAATPTGDPRHAHPDEVVAATVQAAVPLVVAAELRRIATELRARADALDPVGSESR
jgi:hypothetical protein